MRIFSAVGESADPKDECESKATRGVTPKRFISSAASTAAAQLLQGLATGLQAQIDAQQNRVITMLTIITTIFLPLTLLVGWYGMNFAGMPELTWKYGYPVIVVVSIVIVGISLWVCKRKKFW